MPVVKKVRMAEDIDDIERIDASQENTVQNYREDLG